MKKRSHFWFCSFPRQFVRLLRNKKLYDIKESYYPELEHKSKCQIFCDQFKHLLKYHHIESNYFLYGFDVKNFRRMEDYLDYGRYVSRRDYLNNPLPFVSSSSRIMSSIPVIVLIHIFFIPLL